MPEYGPTLEFSEQLHAQKYRMEGESFRESCSRVASALTDDKEHFEVFRDLLLDQAFLPAGRVQAAMGAPKNVTPYNCFVSGTIEDSFTEGHGSIMARATEAATTMRMGGGIGYDFSTLRPRGDLIKKLQSQASGPVSFMEIFDAVCRCVASSGHRRGAQMGVLRVDHPDIVEFIHAKQNNERLTGFNVSIGVTDEFMECVRDGKPFRLRFNNQTYGEVNAKNLWEMIMRSTWDWAEPGVLFIDTINRMNNLWYCEDIAATNPCGEQPLPPYGACLLGSLNLAKFVRRIGIQRYDFDWDRFGESIAPIVRAMDNIVDRATYPMYEQEKEAKSKRRMGLGVTGLANAGEAMGWKYGSPEFIHFTQWVLKRLAREAYLASAELAKEKGPFPMYDPEQYLGSLFVQSLDPEVQEAIRKNGIRNSHLTSIAPTGTISLTADNVSSGIEPVFAYEVERKVRTFEGEQLETVSDYGYRVFGVKGKTADQVTVQEHMAVLAAASQYVDSSVSKTCNVPGSVSWDEFKQLYVTAWETGCKGCTTFRIDGKRMAMMVAKDDAPAAEDEPAEACYIDPVTGRRECA